MFYCREKELSDMNKRYAKDKFECLVVYGRRRIGKTALIAGGSASLSDSFCF